MNQKRTRRQLTIEALTRVIDQGANVERALTGYDDKLAREIRNSVLWSLENRRRKLVIAERKANQAN